VWLNPTSSIANVTQIAKCADQYLRNQRATIMTRFVPIGLPLGAALFSIGIVMPAAPAGAAICDNCNCSCGRCHRLPNSSMYCCICKIKSKSGPISTRPPQKMKSRRAREGWRAHHLRCPIPVPWYLDRRAGRPYLNSERPGRAELGSAKPRELLTLFAVGSKS
jgi:Na+-transporting NADH:ubiquinone oxidoreductase subunit NqrF